MQNMHPDASASDTWQSCKRCFPEKTLYRFQEIYPKGSHRDAAYHREATLAAKDFISSMESGKDIYTCIDAGRDKRTAENKKKM